MMKTKQKGAARSDGSNKKSNKQQPKSSRRSDNHRSMEARKQQPTNGDSKKKSKQPKISRHSDNHRSTEAHQRKQQPTNRVDDSNSDRGRGRQTEWETYFASLTEERVLVSSL